MSYLTVSELRDKTIVSDISTCTDDKKLDFLLEYCSSLIDSFVQSSFKLVVDDTIVLSGDGEKYIRLPRKLVTLKSLNIDNESISISNLLLQEEGKVLYFTTGDRFYEGEYNILVTGDTGWATVPSDVIVCLLTLCNGNFSLIDDSEVLENRMKPYQSEKIGNYSYTLRGKTNITTGEDINTTGDDMVDLILSKYRKNDSVWVGVI